MILILFTINFLLVSYVYGFKSTFMTIRLRNLILHENSDSISDDIIPTINSITSGSDLITQEPVKVEYILRSRSITGGPAPIARSTSFSPQSNRFNRGPPKEQPPINEYIKHDRIRVIVADKNEENDISLDIISLAEALVESENRGVDLVLINDKTDPPYN